MTRRRIDALFVVVVGATLLGAVYVGARSAVTDPAPIDRQRVVNPHGGLVGRGQDQRRGVDPYNPPGLPAGVTIDPTTGLLMGLDLSAEKGQHTPSWTLLAQANETQTVAELSSDIRSLDGRPVVLAGFMMALYALRNIREFALVGSHTKCCFGIPPGVGDQIVVRLARDQEGLALRLEPLRVTGTFRIRPQHLYRDGSGPLIWLYEIVGARVVPYGG